MKQRSIGRQTWKAYYRMQRIAKREALKAYMDAIVYGSGFVRMKDGFVNHVLTEAVYA